MVKTLVIDNFTGGMTQYTDGDINSGRSNVFVSSGANPFARPGNLTWNPDSTQIDPAGSVITDLIMDGKERVENGILYVYAIGHTGRLYKIQVNDPSSYNADYDNPVLLATLTAETPTFTRGGSIDFFGSTERIYIGHDKGVTRIDFDGTTLQRLILLPPLQLTLNSHHHSQITHRCVTLMYHLMEITCKQSFLA